MLRTFCRNGWRRWSGLVGTTGGQSAQASALAPACAAVIETLETRAMLHADHGTSTDHDAEVMEATAVNATGAVTLPLVTIVASDPDAHETDRDRGVFKVVRTGSTNKALNVVFTMRGGAKNGADFNKIASSVLIPVGKRAAKIVIKPIDDAKVELPEIIKLALSENKNYTLGDDHTAKVGIRNNDGPTVSISTTDASGSEAANDGAAFRITRTGSTAEPLAVRYTVYGKATNGLDYESVSEKLTIPAGESSATIAIEPVDDIHAETTESVRIQLRIGRYLVGNQGKAALKLGDNDATTAGEGFVTFRAPGGEGQSGHVFHMPVRIGAIPTDLTRALDQVHGTAGTDAAISLSPDGQWMVLHTNRFDSDGNDSDLAIYPVNNLGGGMPVAFDTGTIQPLGKSVVASGGDLIVFESDEGPHETDLWAAARSAGSWSKVLLTGDSTYAVNSRPAISADGTTILFTGGAADGAGQAILEVKTDGTELRTVITQADGPEGSPADAPMGSASYAPNDTIIFRASWDGDQIWKLHEPTSDLSLFSGATNESSPSVLADGRVVTLWADRPSNDDHALELTLRYADGSLLATLLPGVDLPESAMGTAG